MRKLLGRMQRKVHLMRMPSRIVAGLMACALALFPAIAVAQMIQENGIINPYRGPLGPRFDPAKSNPSVALSNGGLTATGTVAGFTGAIGTPVLYQSSGKLYYELTTGTISAIHGDTVGIQNSSAGVTATFPGATANGIGYIADGRVLLNGALLTTIQTFTSSNVICIATDLVDDEIWFRVGSGNWNNSGTANPATDTGGISLSGLSAGPYVPIATTDAVGDSYTVNFGATSYAESVPSGFGNW
jgi:hypothetical protein